MTPTPEIGVVGLLDDVATLVGPAFALAHDADPRRRRGAARIGRFGLRGARRLGAGGQSPALDLTRERALQAFVREAIARGLVASAQDVSGGGFAVAIAESAMWGEQGATVRIAD